MNTLAFVCLKLVRWTGWLLLPLVLAFFATGYAMSGRYGLGVLATEQHALALLRWGWIKQRQTAG